MSFKSVEVDAESIKSILNIKLIGFDKITELDEENLLAAGENYGSVMKRVKLTGEKQGKLIKKTVVMKKDRILSEDIAFPMCKLEIQVYTEILPKMKDLIDKLIEQGVKIDVMWPLCLGVRNYDVILLEDLTETGYTLRNRRIPMPPEVALVVVEKLGKFHALSLALIERKMIDLNNLPANRFAENMPVLNNIFGGGLITLADTIQHHPKWSNIGDKLRSLASNIGNEISKMAEQCKDIFPVICHGDCWSNNILFKFDPKENPKTPSSLKFVDFQVSHYSCFAWDIVYLMNSSMSGKDKQTCYHKLIATYRDSLIQTLTALKENQLIKTVPSFDDMLECLEKLALFSMTVSFSLFPLTVNTMEKPWDFEKAITNEQVNTHSPEMYTNETFVNSFEVDVVKFKSQGLL